MWRYHWFRWWLVACSALSHYLNQLKDRWSETSWRPCCVPAIITVIKTRVVSIQIAKWADPRARTMGHVGSQWVFCLKSSHGSAGPIGRLRVCAGYPSQETKWCWSDYCFHQRRYAIYSNHLNDQRHIWIHLYLTDLICSGKSFQILGCTVHPCMFCYLYSKHKAMFGEIWSTIMAIIQIVPTYINSM